MRAARRPVAALEGVPREPEHIASVLLNTGAGGGAAGDPATVRRIRDAFASHGWASEITCIPAWRFAGEAPLRVRDARGVVVAAGGDGTVNITANACRAHRRPLGLLPLGRTNLAARSLGLEPDVERAAATIAGGRAEAVQFAELNGRLFLTSALFGLYPALLACPHASTSTPGWRERLSALASGLRMLARSNAPFEAVLEAGAGGGGAVPGDRVRATTMRVALDLEPSGPGQLLLTGLARHERWPTLSALLGATFESSEPAGGITARASRIVVHTPRMQVPVMMDGDLRVMEAPLEFRVRASGLQVVRLPGSGSGQPA
ncbi:MAG: hypothetical protein K2W80_04380 [Burkholderiales bacterium]|nr:hypothetical protein [Burkholderiales bacterium]